MTQPGTLKINNLNRKIKQMNSVLIKWTLVAALLLGGSLLLTSGKHQVAGAKDSPAARGIVKFEGPRPRLRSIRMTEKGGKPSDCRKLYKGPLLDENRVVSEKGELANVFVYVREGLKEKS